ncbi:Na+/melibiose symporter-like transporter [Brevibacterium sanguinis]|uniref:Na+/melibiose symporter-like transporter n=3 Tax=Brevibacteriaceae TaxID=85019 RepID=A0A366ICN3_9MICO|nr:MULTISPECIES: MFS transporter [Brevibacterium]RBP61494.1 Na+/melibiose symporter-like transporter [Brevibacterium sanguinis]RBP68588.1 Na+/melibiose symporter-like transporter [Brevibacterium celere]
MSNIAPTAPDTKSRHQRKVAFAALIGTTIEWYDYFTYSTAAALVFAHLYFAPAGEAIGQMLAFATIGISFLFRPLGAFLSGHYGDKLGRRFVLVVTLITMGVATALIGLIPTYETIGIAAPILLIVLRIVQGLSAGGEWGGAALLAVEHADDDRRGRAGSSPQLGVPLGMLLSSGVVALMTGVISPGEAFMEWGWRVPFLLSIVLIGVGYWVRRTVEDTPVFREMNAEAAKRKAPIIVLLRKHLPLVIVAALIFAGNNASGYMTTGGFVTKYATDPVGFDRTAVLLAITFGSFVWLVATAVSGVLADRIGRVKTYTAGFVILIVTAFPLFWLIDTGSLGLLYLALGVFSIGLGLSYGPQAALYVELFPASVRFSGVAISYALGAVIGGAFAPTIAQALLEATGTTASVSLYLVVMAGISLVAVSLVRDRAGIDLSVGNEEEQSTGVWRKRR